MCSEYVFVRPCHEDDRFSYERKAGSEETVRPRSAKLLPEPRPTGWSMRKLGPKTAALLDAPTTQPSHPAAQRSVHPPPPPPIDSDVAELLHGHEEEAGLATPIHESFQEIERRGKRTEDGHWTTRPGESRPNGQREWNELATSTNDGLGHCHHTVGVRKSIARAVKLRSLRRALHPPPDVETLSVISLEKGTACCRTIFVRGDVSAKPNEEKVEKKRRNEDEEMSEREGER
ncbi:hypothetical protein niasHT_006132 [Heterodera trifolii]|uniref:Uncharacterized protein n=1 Tax=Heterodera trifolii TaxID=157864 RepID=A0ABD2M6I2_9BILA